jgi:hypothetical protein
MNNITEMNKIADAAKRSGNNSGLVDGHASGEIAGRKIDCYAVQVRTNGRCITQMTWYIDGKRASKAKVAAL